MIVKISDLSVKINIIAFGGNKEKVYEWIIKTKSIIKTK